MADDNLIPQLINLLGNKALIAQQQPAWQPQQPQGDPWAGGPPIAQQNLQPGQPMMPPVPPPPMQQMQQPPQMQQPGVPAPQGGGLVDQITQFMMHPLTQGAMGAIGGALSGGRGRQNVGSRIGNAFLGGMGGAEAATRTQIYQQQSQAQIEHQKQLEQQRKDELVVRRQEKEQAAKHQERQEQIQGYQSPEQVAAFREQISGSEDPLVIQAMKLVPPDSPTYRKDLTDTYKLLADRDNKQDALKVKEEYGTALLAQRQLLQDAKTELALKKMDFTSQAGALRLDLQLKKLDAQIDKNKQDLALEREKMTNTNLRAAEGLVTKYATSTGVLLEQNPLKKQEMIQQYRNDLYGSFGIPIQPAAPLPGTTPPFPVNPGNPIVPGPRPAGAAEGPPAQPEATHRFNPATGRAEPIKK